MVIHQRNIDDTHGGFSTREANGIVLDLITFISKYKNEPLISMRSKNENVFVENKNFEEDYAKIIQTANLVSKKEADVSLKTFVIEAVGIGSMYQKDEIVQKTLELLIDSSLGYKNLMRIENCMRISEQREKYYDNPMNNSFIVAKKLINESLKRIFLEGQTKITSQDLGDVPNEWLIHLLEEKEE